MYKNTIRYFFILIVSYYIFYKSLNIKPQNKHTNLILILISLTASICSSFLFILQSPLQIFSILLLFFFSMIHFTKLRPSVIYPTAIFSFALSYIAFNLSSFIIMFILTPFYYGNYNVPWELVLLAGSIIHCILIYCFFRIPRLRKGMNFLYHIPSSNTGSALCIFLIVLLIMFWQSHTYHEYIMWVFCSIVYILSFLLIYWWNFHITQTYRKYLKKSELESLSRMVEERESQIEHLKSEYDKLSHIIHKDNKLIPALSMAVNDFLENKNRLSQSDLEKYGRSLQEQLNTLYDDRFRALTDYQQNIFPIPSTNFPSVDAVLLYMQQKALNVNIQYQVTLSHRIPEIIPTIISEEDCTHLLSDLLENAIIATKNTSAGIVQVYIGYVDTVCTIKIYNTGTPFAVETLENFGLTRHTTHSATGGSGIGLIDIWKIKEKYQATLLLDEVCSAEDKHTCISLLFNKKNHYIIQSDRYQELQNSINRPDLMLLARE